MSEQKIVKIDFADGNIIEAGVHSATIGQDVVDMRAFGKSGMWSFDPGFLSTAACESKITYIDGDLGKLSYRGYPIEQLAEKSGHIEGAYLLLNGELPTKEQLQAFTAEVSDATVPQSLQDILNGLPQDSHPMAMLTSLVGAMAAYCPEGFNFKDDAVRNSVINKLIAKIHTLNAMCYRRFEGLDFIAPDNSLSYSENFLYMMFGKKPDARIAAAMDTIFLLHADHEQNASTSTVRMAGSTGTHPYAAVAAGVAALWGPSHGGANEAVLNMLDEIGDVSKVDDFMAGVKDKKYRLMGFGHRVYKNTDPRAKIIRQKCYEVLDVLGKHDDPLFKLAMKLEKIALEDEYFISKKLYPNVDFYSGIILRAVGITPKMFTNIFALARTVGWLAQWQEMIVDPDMKISRPRQLYTGNAGRDYLNITSR